MISMRLRRSERGMVLVTALLMLVVVTVLAVSMFRSFGIDEKIAGNMREKHRAVNAAESAEQYAEWWLAAGNGTTGVPCTTVLAITAITVCSNVIPAASVPVLPWLIGGAQVGVNYIPPNMNLSTTGGQGNYYQTPQLYIAYLGPTISTQGSIYQIDAVGYGGTADTAAVVESTYAVQTNVKCLSCNP
jgi:type IV pilus assembly protein PilX